MPEFLADNSILYEGAQGRATHRLTAIYSVEGDSDVAAEFGIEYADWGHPVTKYLNFDRLAERYEADTHQFPRVLFHNDLDHEAVDLRTRTPIAISACRLWVLAVPHGALATAFTFEVDCGLLDLIDAMEVIHHRRFAIRDQSPWDAICGLVTGDLRSHLGENGFGAETHQMVFPSEASRRELIDPAAREPNRVSVSQLIYRYRGEYRDGEQRIEYPAESNRSPDGLAAVGPYSAVVFGNQSYVENAYFVSTVLMIGAAALLRRIRRDAYEELLRLRRITSHSRNDISRLRTELAVMTERLSRLEIELSFGVEANENVASLLPSLRVTDYHRAAFATADIPHEAQIVGRMIERLDRALRFELETVRTAERLGDERRRVAAGVFAGFLSVIAIPLAIVFGFFSTTTDNVSRNTSMFDFSHYSGLYLALAGIMVVAGVLGAGVVFSFRRADRKADRYRKDVDLLSSLPESSSVPAP